MKTNKTNFPVTEQMINDWSDNLVNQPTNIDGEPIVATSDNLTDRFLQSGDLEKAQSDNWDVNSVGCSARSYNPSPSMPMASGGMVN